jgi:hypothetical protein
MNTAFKKSFLVLFLLTAGFLISAHAQHERESRGQRGNSYSGRSGGSYTSRNSGDFNHQHSFDRSPDLNRQNNNGSIERRINDNRLADRKPAGQNNSTFRRNNIPAITDSRNEARNAILNAQRATDLNPQRVNRTVVVNNTVRINNYSRYPRVYNYNRYGGYSFVHYNYYAPRRYVYAGAPRYRALPRTFISINFGGYPYWYYGGDFYSYYDGFYEPVFAPIGIHVTILPSGYFPIYVGPALYYYYDGVYYRRYHDHSDEYEVVDAPMGAVVSSLPKGATEVVLNGEKFYEFNGTYYKEGTNSKNEVVYTVVGKNGVINNTDEQPVTNSVQAPQVGDEITVLPENSKQVTINGEVLYVTPDHLYLKAETRGNTTTYKVVGKAENN